MIFHTSDARLRWRPGPHGGYGLHAYGRPTALLHIVPDDCPGMWRVMWREQGEGQLSDMVNLTRACDAGTTMALAQLDKQKTNGSMNGQAVHRQ
jgi:hypothetical protein